MKLTVDTKQLEKNFDSLARQLPFITSLAINDTAFDVRKQLRLKTKRVLSIKKQAVVNAFRVKNSSKVNLVGEVFVSDKVWQHDVLEHHFRGGDRERKGLEDMLRHMGAMSRSQILTPSGKGAFVKKRGFKDIASALRKTYPSGYNTNVFKRSGKFAKESSRRGNYFIATKRDKRTAHLDEGIYFRLAGEKFLVSILTISSKPQYKKRLDIKQIAQKVVNARFPIHFNKAIKKAMRTAR